MPTTSNFGWTTPADTDLVKDGAAAIRTLGNGIDTSLVDLKGGTTGQILSKASNTDLDYTWIANDQGDITEVQAGTGISVASGTGPIPVITNTVATAFDAAGDLVYGTGADTFTKLSLGTAGKVLTVNSGATAPEWATPAAGGGMTLLNSGGTALSGSTTSISSISSAYQDLAIYVVGPAVASAGAAINFRINAATTNYRESRKVIGATDINNALTATSMPLDLLAGYTTTGTNNLIYIYIAGYAQTGYKPMIGYTTYEKNGGGDHSVLVDCYTSSVTAAINQITFLTSTGNFGAGTIYLYGVK